MSSQLSQSLMYRISSGVLRLMTNGQTLVWSHVPIGYFGWKGFEGFPYEMEMCFLSSPLSKLSSVRWKRLGPGSSKVLTWPVANTKSQSLGWRTKTQLLDIPWSEIISQSISGKSRSISQAFLEHKICSERRVYSSLACHIPRWRAWRRKRLCFSYRVWEAWCKASTHDLLASISCGYGKSLSGQCTVG